MRIALSNLTLWRTTPVTAAQTYLNVPPAGPQRIAAPAPGNCPF